MIFLSSRKVNNQNEIFLNERFQLILSKWQLLTWFLIVPKICIVWGEKKQQFLFFHKNQGRLFTYFLSTDIWEKIIPILSKLK